MNESSARQSSVSPTPPVPSSPAEAALFATLAQGLKLLEVLDELSVQLDAFRQCLAILAQYMPEFRPLAANLHNILKGPSGRVPPRAHEPKRRPAPVDLGRVTLSIRTGRYTLDVNGMKHALPTALGRLLAALLLLHIKSPGAVHSYAAVSRALGAKPATVSVLVHRFSKRQPGMIFSERGHGLHVLFSASTRVAVEGATLVAGKLEIKDKVTVTGPMNDPGPDPALPRF